MPIYFGPEEGHSLKGGEGVALTATGRAPKLVGRMVFYVAVDDLPVVAQGRVQVVAWYKVSHKDILMLVALRRVLGAPWDVTPAPEMVSCWGCWWYPYLVVAAAVVIVENCTAIVFSIKRECCLSPCTGTYV